MWRKGADSHSHPGLHGRRTSRACTHSRTHQCMVRHSLCLPKQKEESTAPPGHPPRPHPLPTRQRAVQRESVQAPKLDCLVRGGGGQLAHVRAQHALQNIAWWREGWGGVRSGCESEMVASWRTPGLSMHFSRQPGEGRWGGGGSTGVPQRADQHVPWRVLSSGAWGGWACVAD